jgi:hypothetical protein
MNSRSYNPAVPGKGLSWGWKIMLMYLGFVALILSLVIASSHQHFDLVSKDYYADEIAYQKVIDAGKNQSSLSRPVSIYANEKAVTIEFPDEFKTKELAGNIQFYAPANAEWDRNFKISTQDNKVTIPRSGLRNTRYTIKISCNVGGKSYYQESEIMLHQ